MMRKQKILFTGLLLTVFFINMKGQEGNTREVSVVKPYVPTLSDANRINLLPEFKDTTRVYADFDYEITPKRFTTNFRVKPIPPAKMKGLALKRLYKSQLTLGVGNYLTPYAELTVNQLRDRKTAIGFYAKHHSSGGKVKLDNGEKVASGFSDNIVNLYGRKMFSSSVVEGSINGGYNTLLYYGYDPNVDTVLRKDDIRQRISTVGAGLKYYSSHPDSSHFNYRTELDYGYLKDFYGFAEHGVKVNTLFATFLGDFYGSLNTGFQLYSRNDNLDSSNNAILTINPSISKATDEWRFVVGFNSAFDIKNGKAPMTIYPKVDFEFNIVKNVLIPYMGITGYKQVNTYRSLLVENPWILPGTLAENTNYSMIGFVGLKGRYSSRMAFDFRAKYSVVDSMHFFINNASDTLQNQFIVGYDNVNILNIGGEITWNHTEKLKFILRGDYYSYEMSNEEYPWHKSSFTASLNTSYNLRDKILLDANLFFTGKRMVSYPYNYEEGPMAADFPGHHELSSYIDLNISAEYRYTSMLSFFLRMNNLSASKYHDWFLYPCAEIPDYGRILLCAVKCSKTATYTGCPKELFISNQPSGLKR